jgi:hypothetical protein
LGAAYLTGHTTSPNFPTTAGAIDVTFNGSDDVFVTKLSVAGSALSYSTYVGGRAHDDGYDIAVDASGAAYVTGATQSANFPTRAGSFDQAHNGGTSDAFVAKVSAAGTSLLYSTFLGGSADDYGYAIAVDGAGAAHVAGRTFSTNFATTAGAFDTTFNGGNTDAFAAKLSPSGNALAYSTYLGGTADDYANAVAIDAAGSAYATGITHSAGFPTTAGTFDTTHNGSSDAFVTKLPAAGSSLAYSTFLGGTGGDNGNAVAVDGSGAAYVTGNTTSTAFPATAGAFDATHNGSTDAFVTKLDTAGNALVYSTYLGGSSIDFGNGVAVDSSGAAYVAGYTFSTAFPTTAGAFDTSFNGGGVDAFATKLSAAGDAAVYSTYLGGDDSDFGLAVAVDASGAAYLTGHTSSTTFPTTPGAADTTHNGGTDAFVTKLSAAGSSLASSTFLGGSADEDGRGIAIDSSGAAYVTGQTLSPDFPATGFGDREGASAFVLKVLANAIGADTPGVYLGGTGSWFLRNSNSAGGADLVFGFGPSGLGWLPLRGDWDGDGTDTIGLYDGSTGNFFLRNQNAAGGADLVFSFGPGGAGFVPVVGDWNGDGTDTVGAYDPGSGAFFLRNQNAPGAADLVFTFGAGGLALMPLAGDWDGDGADTVGLYDAATGYFFLRNTNGPGGADLFFSFGSGGAGVVPLTGDYDGDGDDTVGIYTQVTGTWFLKLTNESGGADLVFGYGPTRAQPLVGDWDGL